MSFSRALNCSDEAFDCGVVGYIAYPFWGGDRPSECGRKGFEIACLQGKIPILKISPLSYIIQELDFSTNTVRVARQDVQDTNCPQPLHNTTIDWELFKYPPNSTDRNLTLYFDCATNIHMQPNAFPCANQTNSNLFKINGDGDGDGDGISCNTNIYVPVNREDAESLQNPTASSINSLRSALITGFSIQWLNDSRQGSAPFCNANVYSSCISYASLKPDRPFCNSTRTTYAECLRKENQGRGTRFLFFYAVAFFTFDFSHTSTTVFLKILLLPRLSKSPFQVLPHFTLKMAPLFEVLHLLLNPCPHFYLLKLQMVFTNSHSLSFSLISFFYYFSFMARDVSCSDY